MSLQIGTVAEMIEQQLWQFTIVALILAAAVLLCSRRRPHLAYALLVLILIKGVTPPVLESRLALLPPRVWGTQEELPVRGTIGNRDVRPPAETRARAASDVVAPRIAAANSRNASAAPPKGIGVRGMAAAVWLIGVLLAGLIRCAQAARLMRFLRRAERPQSGPFIEVARQTAHELGVRRRFRLAISPDGVGPAVIGLVRPTIILPAGLVRRCPTAEWKAILAHELIHIRRHDAAVALLQAVVHALWWFHPLAHWVHRRLVCERERCTDDAVLAGGVCSREEYAGVLLTVLRMKHEVRPLGGLAVGTSPADITRQRLERIMCHKGFRVRMPLSCWVVLLAVAALALPAAPASDGSGLPGKSPETPQLDRPAPNPQAPSTAAGGLSNWFESMRGDSPQAGSAESGRTIELIVRSWPWSSKPLADLDTGRTYPAPMLMVTIGDGGSDSKSMIQWLRGGRDVVSIGPEDLYQKLDGPFMAFEPMTSEEAAAWRAAQGVDLRAEAEYQEGRPGGVRIWGEDLIAVPTVNQSWNQAPESLVSQFDDLAVHPDTSVLVDGSTDLPKTFLFRTRGGARGVLQVLAYTRSEPKSEWFRTAILRFKLLDAKQPPEK